MQFHYDGYVSEDPRNKKPAGFGINRPDELPEIMDVLIVGTGPAGMITAAQLAQYPNINTRIVEKREGRLIVGQADGVQKRSVETFMAFSFADEITAEAAEIVETAFWHPNPADSSKIIRKSRVPEDPKQVSEFPHLIVNQARVLDYFAMVMANSPTKMKPDYGFEYESHTLNQDTEYPIEVKLTHTVGAKKGQSVVVKTKYLISAEGAHSKIQKEIGSKALGDSSDHAWGVLDILAITDFPDVRVKCAIQSQDHGGILLIPREGGHLFRLYVDLGEITPETRKIIRSSTAEKIIAQAQKILHPYTLDVKEVAWHSVYEVGHRVCDRFDNVPFDKVGQEGPRIFIMGDASHTHSAKAGQGMNVSMQDGWNLAWKLAHVLEGRSPLSLLATYNQERQKIGEDIIRFDKEWASDISSAPLGNDKSYELEKAYQRITEFAQGFMTQYEESVLTGATTYQHLAQGFPIGKRFKSAKVMRIADANLCHLGHEATADGRWRIYIFADNAPPHDKNSESFQFAQWLTESEDSPTNKYTPSDLDTNAWFDIKVIYQQLHTKIEQETIPKAFMTGIGPMKLTDYHSAFATSPEFDIFKEREIDRRGVIVVVRPDQYVANILPLAKKEALTEFIAGFTLPQ